MDFQLAFIKNPQQIVLKDFGQETNDQRGKVMDIDELSNLNLQGVFLSEELLENPDFLGSLNTTTEKNPIRTA